MDKFQLVAKSILEWTQQNAEPSAPHQENIPADDLVRRPSATNWLWVELYGEEYIL